MFWNKHEVETFNDYSSEPHGYYTYDTRRFTLGWSWRWTRRTAAINYYLVVGKNEVPRFDLEIDTNLIRTFPATKKGLKRLWTYLNILWSFDSKKYVDLGLKPVQTKNHVLTTKELYCPWNQHLYSYSEPKTSKIICFGCGKQLR